MAQIYSTTKNVSSSGYGSGSFVYRIRVVENSTNIANNKGNYTIYFDVMPVKTRYQSWNDTNATFRINTSNGQSINADNNIRGSSSAMNYNTYTNIGSWTGDLTHKEDGSLTITTSITYGFSSSQGNYLPLETNISGTATATIIPRYSDLTCNTPVDMGTTQTVSVVQKSTDFSHILYYKTSLDSSYTEIGRNTGVLDNTYSWTLPDITSQIPNASYDNYELLVETYLTTDYSGEHLDTTLTVVANVPSSYVPTIAITSVSEGNNDVPSTFPFIVGYSKLNVTTLFTGSANSTVINRGVQVGNEVIASQSTDASVSMQFTQPLTQTTNTVYATTTDSRGRVGTATQSVSAYAYQSPTVAIDYTRCDSNGNVDALGDYLLVKAKWFYDDVNNLNSATIKVYIDDTLEYTYTPSVDEQTTWTNIALLSGILTTSQYDIKVVIEDLLASANVSGTVAKATVPFSLYDNDTDLGVALGRMATEEGFRNYMNEYVVSGNTINLLDTTGKTVLDTMNMDDLFNGTSKFIYNQPITLYDTDGTTVLNTKNSQDMLFNNNGTIENFEGNTILNLDYSTTETNTGTYWIDGKPIYRKVVQVTTTSGTNTITAQTLGLQDRDTLVSLEGYTKQPSTNHIVPISYYQSSTDWANWYIYGSNGTLALRHGSAYGFGATTLVFEYTKTTN